MARINIENEWWTDPRRERLASKLGDPIRADGIMIRVWLLSQTYWKDLKRHFVPRKQFETLLHWKEVVECDLAELVDNDFYYVRGTKSHHEWLNKKTENAKMGGLKKAQRVIEIIEEKSCQTLPNSAKLCPLTLPLSPTPTQSLKTEEFKSSEGVKKTTPSVGSRIFESYKIAYVKRYGVEPVRNATVNSQCTALGKRLGEEAIKVVEFYLGHNDPFFIREQHPIGLCLSKAEGLITQMRRGVQTGAAPKGKERQPISTERKDDLNKLGF